MDFTVLSTALHVWFKAESTENTTISQLKITTYIPHVDMARNGKDAETKFYRF